MATNQATVQDLGRRMLRPLTADETVWAGTALGDAFGQILVQLPDVGQRLDDPDLPADAPFRQIVVAVQCAMLQRVLLNPEGVLEETIDDHTRRLDAAVSTGALYLTDGERGLLAAGTGKAEGAFSVRAGGSRAGRWFPRSTTDTPAGDAMDEWPPMSGAAAW